MASRVSVLQHNPRFLAEPPSTRLPLSCFCAALTIFLVINLIFRWADSSLVLSNDQVSAAQLDFKGTINGVKALPTVPNVVCLGSSLTLFAHWQSDLKLGIRTPDPNHYHYAFSFEKALNLLGFRNSQTYDSGRWRRTNFRFVFISCELSDGTSCSSVCHYRLCTTIIL